MRLWAEEEFDRVAQNTRQSANTIAACREVLVHGMTGVEAGQKHGVLPPHVSRGIKVLEERRKELRKWDQQNRKALQTMEVAASVTGLLKAAALEAARSIKGDGWIIREAIPGEIYEGSGVVKTGGYYVQDIGRVGVVHDLKNVDLDPELGKRVEITYSKSGKGTVTEIPLNLGTREHSR